MICVSSSRSWPNFLFNVCISPRYRTFLPSKPDPIPSFFSHAVKNPKFEPFWPFWPWHSVLEGLRSRKTKIITTQPFLGQKKVRSNFMWEKLMEFLLPNEVLKNWIFFLITYQKSGFITLILSKFQILNANLWSIYSKRFEFMAYTFICVFWKKNLTSEAL